MSNDKIFWDFFKSKGYNDFAIAGLIGNIYAESGINPKNLQGSFNTKFGLTDDEYVKKVDNGSYSNFVNDSAGFGLAQWTYHTRKKNLMDYMKSKKYSIGDMQGQMEFLWKELSESYTSVHKSLLSAKSIREASDVVLLKFEKPANQSESVQEKRASYGKKYYDLYAGKATTTTTTTTKEVNKMDYSKHTKYIESTGTHYISNSGHDENGKYKNGAAGDQKGDEWALKAWYNRPWTVVLRYEKDPRVGYLMAQLSCAAALNNNIGYDQNQRGTYWTQLQKVNYDPSAITTKCEEDCTAGVTANTKAVGYLLGIESLQKLSTGIYSGNMKSNFTKAGFTALTAKKYLTSAKHLEPGDVLLYENHHAAANVTIGASIKSEYKKPDISKVKFNGVVPTPAPETSKPVEESKPETEVKPTVQVSVDGQPIGTAVAKQDMHLRDSADSSGNSISIISKGDTVYVYEILENGWMKVKEKDYENIGYTSNRNNSFFTYSPVNSAAKNVEKAKVKCNKLYVRKGPARSYGAIRVITKGTQVTIYEKSGDFGRIGDGEWIHLNYVKKI